MGKYMLRIPDGKFLALFVMLAVGSACSVSDPQETEEKELVSLPSEVQYQWEFAESWNESAKILIITSENELYLEQVAFVKDPQFDLKEQKLERISITKEQLPEELKGVSEVTDPAERIVYLKVDAGAKFDHVLSVLRSIREAGIIWAGLITEKKPQWKIGQKGLFRVKLPASEEPLPLGALVRPNPLFLVAGLDESGSLRLNMEKVGTISDTGKLEALLSDVLKKRSEEGVFREGTNEIEKTVLLKASGSSSYGDVVKLVDALKGSGADPIGIVLDEPKPGPTADTSDLGSYDESEPPDNTNSQEE